MRGPLRSRDASDRAAPSRPPALSPATAMHVSLYADLTRVRGEPGRDSVAVVEGGWIRMLRRQAVVDADAPSPQSPWRSPRHCCRSCQDLPA